MANGDVRARDESNGTGPRDRPPRSGRGLSSQAELIPVQRHIMLPLRKRIVLIAHDNQKLELLEWARYNRGTLAQHDLLATGTTGQILADELDLPVTRFVSGPMGGDQQVGAAIVEGRIDVVIFFWDPLEPHPHDVDVKALLRIAVVYNVPIACNRSSADFLLSSPLMLLDYERLVTAYEARLEPSE
jgi:methylglyoxal synthase